MGRSVFLIGGGNDPAGVAECHRPFVAAVGAGPIVVVAVADEAGGQVDEARWTGDLRSAGADEVRVVVPDDGRPLTVADTAGAAGVYVAGGLTPRDRRLLVDDAEPGWLPADVPYAGFSAGCAVAAERAIVGGWRHAGVAVCPPEAGEDLQDVTVAAGLGVVPFGVDVHAAQWGTLPRLLHAVQARLVPEGWAIDEHTCLAVDGDGRTTVHGRGTAYRVARARVDVHVTPVRARRAG